MNDLDKLAILVDIRRENKRNILIFNKGGKLYQLSMKAEIEDNFAQWRKVLFDYDDSAE